jgi:hypothetical protein
MHKNATKCNKTLSKWCKKKHGASKIMDTFETYQWTEEIHKQGPSKKAMTSLVMLISWEIWKERNTHVFRNTYTTSRFIIIQIKEEIALWSLTSTKAVGNTSTE